MLTVVKGIVVGVLLLCSGAALAQQDPKDSGLADSIAAELATYRAGDQYGLVVDVYVFEDQPNLMAFSAVFGWDHPGLVYDSTVGSPLADSAFDIVQSYTATWANSSKTQALNGVSIARAGLVPTLTRQYMGTLYFHFNAWQPGDEVNWDTTTAVPGRSRFCVGDLGTTDCYVPQWGGKIGIVIDSVPTAVTQPGDESALPLTFSLSQNYPNPFNPSTAIDYSLPTASIVELAVFNQLGQRVAALADGLQTAGDHRVYWNGRDDDGNPVASGVYLYRLTAGDFTQSRKMLLLK